MIAYGNKSLDKLTIHSEVSEAFRLRLISRQEKDEIAKVHEVDVYHPNLFIRIGLFLATCVIVSMTFGLLMLILGGLLDSGRSFGVICAIFSIILFTGLEYLIQSRKHFRSGVDDALLWLSFGFLVTAYLLLSDNFSGINISLICMILAAAATVRYAYPLASAVLFCSIISLLFNIVILGGNTAKAVLPFIMLLISAMAYAAAKNFQSRQVLRHYTWSFNVVMVLSLIGMYASVNYFVVRELSALLLGSRLASGASITAGWFFWLATVSIPAIYIVLGLYKKDILVLRTGLVLAITTIFTITHYYPSPPEQLLTLSGVIILLLVYGTTKYLKRPRHGISVDEPDESHLPVLLHVESLAVAETFSVDTPAEEPGFRYGGGSSGGGGATGEY